MPIQGLTTQHKAGSGLPRLGTLRKGSARTEEDIARKRPGKDLEHFRVEFEPEFAFLQPAFEELYGAKPKELGGAFVLDGNVDEAFSSWMEAWGQSGLIHRCDGAIQAAWFDATLGRVNREPKACEGPGCNCKQIGRLNLFFPALSRHSGAMGYMTLSTHSVRDIKHLYHLLADLQSMYGTLMGVPLVLGRRPETFEVPKTDRTGKPTGERMKITKSLIHLRPDQTFIKANTAPALGSGEQPALPSNVNPETGEIHTQPSLPAPSAKRWTEKEATAWVKHVIEEYTLTTHEIMAALNITKLGDWNGSVKEATDTLNAWIDEMLYQGEAGIEGEVME